MKTYTIIAIALLLVAIIAAGVYAINLKGTDVVITTKSCGSASCNGSCTAENNCGSSSCGATTGGACTCGQGSCGGSCTTGNTCSSSTCGAKVGGSCGCSKA